MKRKFAIVTGGSAGIGLEIARLLAQDDYDLLLIGASGRVSGAAETLAQYGTQVTALQADLSSEAGNQAVLDAVKQHGKPVDVAVLNAGIAIGGAFVDQPLERHLQLLALNITSPVRLTYGLLPDMIARGGGKFLFVSSLSATTPTPYESVYGPSKAFLSSFANSIREELKEQGIQITTLHPGATATEFHARAGMQTTAFGDNSWKNSPELVAKQGYEALLAGKTNVVGGDEATQQAWFTNRSMDEEEKARIHAQRAMPNSPLPRGM